MHKRHAQGGPAIAGPFLPTATEGGLSTHRIADAFLAGLRLDDLLRPDGTPAHCEIVLEALLNTWRRVRRDPGSPIAERRARAALAYIYDRRSDTASEAIFDGRVAVGAESEAEASA